MDKEEALRRVAEGNRILAKGRTTIDRQRELIARLEHMGIDIGKQRTLLSRLLEAQAQQEKRLANLLDWLGPDHVPNVSRNDKAQLR